jgi:hypothetical protein
MATAATTRNLGKTGFVKEFLNDNPRANTKAVNEAWKAAGFDGTIGQTLVTRMRSELGLTGNIPKGPKKKVQPASAVEPAATGKKRGRGKGATVRGGPQGKTAFVRDFIKKDPTANRKAVEEAWLAAGNEGPISSALVSNLRSEMGLTGKRRPKGRGAGKKGRAKSSSRITGADRTAEPVAGTPKPLDRRTNRGRIIEEVEGDIDRLIFKLIAVGGMETIEDELRKVRRLLYRSYSG